MTNFKPLKSPYILVYDFMYFYQNKTFLNFLLFDTLNTYSLPNVNDNFHVEKNPYMEF